MKILLLADSNSSHIIKWAKSLSNNDIEIFIVSLSKCTVLDYDNNHNISTLNLSVDKVNIAKKKTLNKLSYLKIILKLKKIIKDIKPDILHAHYASSYGLLGALSGFKPFIISVWGSDIFDFPKKSLVHKQVIKYNLGKAGKILSTSHVMAKETKKYTDKNIEVTPFGINTEIFKPTETFIQSSENSIIIGTIKALEIEYGLEYLIRAFKIVKDKNVNIPIKLLIVGGGSLEFELKNLVSKLEIEDFTTFTGKIAYNEVPKYHNKIDISVFPSLSESFGVAVIEASSCEKPVVVSNVGGLPEVVESNVTGIIVPAKSANEIANAIEKLIFNKELSLKMGKAGRQNVINKFNWNDNVNQMIGIYKNILR